MPKLIASTVLLVVLVGGVIFAVLPKYQEFKDTQLKLKTKEVELTNKKNYIQTLKQTSEELEKYKEETAKIDSAVPTNLSLPSLFDYLQRASFQNGLIFEFIGSFSSNPLLEKPTIKETYTEFSVSGFYKSAKNLLQTLEKSSRLIEVESVSISPQKQQVKEGETAVPAEEPSLSIGLKIKVRSY